MWPPSSHTCQHHVGLGCTEESSYLRNERLLVPIFSQSVPHLHISSKVLTTKWIKNSFQLDRKCPTAVRLATLSLELILCHVHPWDPGAIESPNVKVPRTLFHLKETQLFPDSSYASLVSFSSETVLLFQTTFSVAMWWLPLISILEQKFCLRGECEVTGPELRLVVHS